LSAGGTTLSKGVYVGYVWGNNAGRKLNLKKGRKFFEQMKKGEKGKH
jgi:hypothetical protein